MMKINAERIRNLITDPHGDIRVEEPRENVYRVTRSRKRLPVGVYYFDCSASLLQPDFDLERYQEELLSDDYYDHEGDLLWNYYLYFVCDEEDYKRLLGKGRVTEIEGNGVFAKKYVTSEDYLFREFWLRTEQWRLAAEEGPEDFGDRWSTKLAEGGLAGAYMPEIACKKVYRLYMEGRPVPEGVAGEPLSALVELPALGFIEGVQLDHYRVYPKDEKFETGPCTLITGVNGSGKTSFLEAIELWACGRTFRNQRLGERPDRVALKFVGSDFVRGERSGASKLYRGRDLLWYGKHHSRGTDLCARFNHFNFYNTDAAVEITSASNLRQINAAISNLVLGETANIIEGRLETLLKSYFEPGQREYEKQYRRLREEIKEADARLRALPSDPGSEEEIFAAFAGELKKVGWKLQVSGIDEESLGDFRHEINKVTARIDECRQVLNWLPDASADAVAAEQQRLRELLGEVERLSALITRTEQTARGLAEQAESADAQVSMLIEWRPYLFRKDATKLKGLGAAMKRSRQQIELYEHAVKALEGLALDRYEAMKETAAEAEAVLNERRRGVRDLLKIEEEKVSRFSQRVGRAGALIFEIRSKAEELLRHQPGVRDCPVCGGFYEVGELAICLSRPSRGGADILPAEFLAGLERARTELTEVEVGLEALQRFKYVSLLLLGPDRQPGMSLGECAAELSTAPETLNRLREEHDELRALQLSMASDGLTEEGYERLRRHFEQQAVDVPLEYDEREIFEPRLAEAERSLEAVRASLGATNERLSELSRELKELLADYLDSQDYAVAELRTRVHQLTAASTACRYVAERIATEPGERLADLSLRAKEVGAAYEQLLKARRVLRESTMLKRQSEAAKRKAEAELSEVKAKKERSESAIAVISKITKGDSKRKYLEQFFQSNTTDIFEIYRLLHTPREFTGVNFDYESGSLTLKEVSGRDRQLTQISSGQRAALSLSIFLALNRKLKHGPRFMLFDDPVALVDDLNVLSFLDYLRDIVMTGERQLFFATADFKVASLLKRKFRFLEDEFKEVTLNR
jgi:exonuclease SbcC